MIFFPSFFLSPPAFHSLDKQHVPSQRQHRSLPGDHGSRLQKTPGGAQPEPLAPHPPPAVHAQLSRVGYSHQQPLQLPQKLRAGLKPPFLCLRQLSRDWSLLPFSKGNAQSDLTNQFYQENTLEKLKLSICGGPYTSFVLITHRARQNTNNQLTHPWSYHISLYASLLVEVIPATSTGLCWGRGVGGNHADKLVHVKLKNCHSFLYIICWLIPDLGCFIWEFCKTGTSAAEVTVSLRWISGQQNKYHHVCSVPSWCTIALSGSAW